jgi:YD repeat-containing protein
VTKITDPNGGNTLFTYDVAGNVLTLKDSVNNTTTWGYDGLGQVTMETNRTCRIHVAVFPETRPSQAQSVSGK